MKKLSDSELQELMDKGGINALPSTEDTNLYQSVYSALNEEIEYELPTNFAHSVAHLVELNSEMKDLKIERLWMTLGSFVMMISMLIVIGVLSIYNDINFGTYLPMIALGSILILVIQYFDRKVKKLYLR